MPELYSPDGRKVEVNQPITVVNLKARGYSENPPSEIPVSTDPVEGTVTFDPAEHTVEEVRAFITEHPDLADQVLAAEAAGQNRKGITGG